MIKKKTKVTNRRPHGFVYFISAGDAIKIGFASKVTNRLKALQTSTHNNLTLLAQAPGNSLLERRYHHQFREYRIRGEWFRADAEPILQEIDRINCVVPEPEPKPVKVRRFNPMGKLRGQLIKCRRGETNPYIISRLDLLVQQIDNRDQPGIEFYMKRTMAELEALMN